MSTNNRQSHNQGRIISVIFLSFSEQNTFKTISKNKALQISLVTVKDNLECLKITTQMEMNKLFHPKQIVKFLLKGFTELCVLLLKVPIPLADFI